MKFDITFERTYPHPVAAVWRALTEPAALGEWLMETDFRPETGREFRMSCDDGEGATDTYHCRVLEIDPPRRMLWSWLLAGHEALGETYVEITVQEVVEGTRVAIRHSGERPPEIVDRFKSGWPHKLQALASAIRGGAGSAA